MTSPRPSRTLPGLRPLTGLSLGALLLAGCSTPVPQPRPQEDQGPRPALVSVQTDRVREDVAAVAAAADVAADPALLAPRMTGAAQQARAARYALAAAVPGSAAPAPVGAGELRTVVPVVGEDGGGTAGWPRTMLSVTEEPGQPQPQLSVLVQDDARSPYRVVATAGLLPGAVLPSTLAETEGSEVLAPDSAEATVPPQDAVARYAEVLTDPASRWAATFTDDPFRAGLAADEAGQADVERADLLETTSSRAPREGALWSFATADGGAVTVAVLDAERTQSVTRDDVSLQLSPDVAALAGDPQEPQSSTARWLEVVVLAVPPAPAEGEPAPQTAAVGADRVLVDAEAA